MPWTSKSAKGHTKLWDIAKAMVGRRQLDAKVGEVGGLGHQGCERGCQKNQGCQG
jgi:hypothetical protein